MKDEDRQIVPATTPAAPTFELERYAPLIEDLELSDAQAEELLRTLWQIMAAFVDLGFELKSLDQLLPEMLRKSGDFGRDLVE